MKLEVVATPPLFIEQLIPPDYSEVKRYLYKQN